MMNATKSPAANTAYDVGTDAVACLARLRATLTVLEGCLETELAVSSPSPRKARRADDAALELRLLAF